MSSFGWPSLVAGLPLAGVLAVLLTPPAQARRAKLIGMAAALLTLVAVIVMAAGFAVHGPRFQFVQNYTWIQFFGVHYAMGVDGIALVLIGLTAVLTPVVLGASWTEMDTGRYGVRTFLALALGLEALAIAAFAATDVFLFYVLFEFSLIPMYFVIGGFGGPLRSYAAVKFLLYSLFGGLLMLVAVIGLYVESASHLHHGTFSYLTLLHLHAHLSPGVQDWLFLGFFIAFAIKAPLWPFHTWLPDAAAEAPTGGAVLLVGVLDKLGTFGFIRYCLPLFPHAARVFAPYVLALSVVSILYGALLAIGQRDLKRLVAYTSISHFGFISLGIFAFTSQAQAGATLYMVNHGFVTAALFIIVGFLTTRRGSRLIADFGGVASVAPWLAGTFLLAGLAGVALPGLNAFVSEFLVLVGTFTAHRAVAVVATMGIILAAIYILYMYQRVMHGPVRAGIETMPDLSRWEAVAVAPVLALIVALGVYPKPLLDVITPAVNRTMSSVHAHDPSPSVPERSRTSPAALTDPAGGHR
jgi:NADH-quinone oxidoreductase subunit M